MVQFTGEYRLLLTEFVESNILLQVLAVNFCCEAV